MAATSTKGPADLARELGLTAYQSDKTVARWLKGENEPSYEPTIELMRLAGWLNEDLIQEALAAAEEAEQEAEDRLPPREPPLPPADGENE